MARFTTSDGLSLHYTDTGRGLPVLCLAGLTRNHMDFHFLAPHLSGVRMIALDSRGRGLSDHDANPANYNIPREARDVVELLDHLGLVRACVIGTSRGGLIAMVLAATARDRLAGVVLNDIGPDLPADGIARIMDYVGRKPAARDLKQAAAGMQAALGPQFPGLSPERWQQLASFQYQDTDQGLVLRYDARLRQALLDQAAAGPAPDLWPLFDAFADLPLGVLRGANSDLFTSATLAEMQRRNTGLIAATVPDRGHVPLLDEAPSLQVIGAVLQAAQARAA